MRIEQRPALELFDIERAKSGKEYPAGTVLIGLSACGSSGQIDRLQEPGQVPGKWACLVPKDESESSYLYWAAVQAFDDFIRREVTTINLQFESLERFTIPYHMNANQRQEFAAMLENVERLERAEEKSYFLRKMFV